MKVHDLIEHLQKFDPNLDVLCWSEDENLLGKKRGSATLDIVSVDCTEAEKVKSKDGRPNLRFKKSATSKKLVLLTVISDF